MDDTEYERLQKAHQLKDGIILIQDAILILRKKPMIFHGAYCKEEAIVKSAVAQFVKDEDIAEILSRKLENLKAEFSQL